MAVAIGSQFISIDLVSTNSSPHNGLILNLALRTHKIIDGCGKKPPPVSRTRAHDTHKKWQRRRPVCYPQLYSLADFFFLSCLSFILTLLMPRLANYCIILHLLVGSTRQFVIVFFIFPFSIKINIGKSSSIKAVVLDEPREEREENRNQSQKRSELRHQRTRRAQTPSAVWQMIEREKPTEKKARLYLND